MADNPARPIVFNAHSPPIVGRSAERTLLLEQLAATAAGDGQLCIVSGEAGIGKTTHVQELVVEAGRRKMQVLAGQCYDLMATSPYGLWQDVASNYTLIAETQQSVPLPEVFRNGDLNNVNDQLEVFDQVRTFLAEVAQCQPTLLVLEDVHWADPASLELIRYISSHLHQLRICMVVTYRVDELTRQNPLYRQLPGLVRESGGVRIDLGSLVREDISTLVGALYPMSDADELRLTEFLVTHSEGNPFFAVEILRVLESCDERGGLWQLDGTWHLAELAPIVVPAMVRHVIDLRLEQLGPTVRHALSLAAVIGQDVPIDLWQLIVGIDHDELLEIIDRAVEWNVMRASTDGTRIQFVHALTRESLYTAILPPRRRILHGEVAEALMKQSHVDADAVAFHLHQAADARTVEWMIRAGERAQRAYAWLTARDQFSTAAKSLAGVPGEELSRAHLLYRCGRLLRYAHAERGISDIRLAQRLAEFVADPVLSAEAEYSLGLLQNYADQWDVGVVNMEAGICRIEGMPTEYAEASYSAVDWFADALPIIELPKAQGVYEAAACLTTFGVNHRRGGLPWFLAYSGHLDRAISEATSFLAKAEQCGNGPLIHAAAGHSWFGLGIAYAATGEPLQARAALAEARALYEPLDHHAVIGFTHLTELQDVVMRFETDNLPVRKRVAAQAAAALERAGGALPFNFSAKCAELPLMYIEGRWEEARMVVGEGISHGNSMLRRPITATMSRIDYHQGRSGSVWQQIQELLPDGPDSQPGSAILPDALLLQSLAVNLSINDSDFASARRWLSANRQWLEWSGSVAGWPEYFVDRARTDMVAGNWNGAADNANKAVQLSMDPRQPLALVAALRMRATVAIARNNREGAESDLREALSLAHACQAPFERALTLVPIGEARIDIGRDAAAEARDIGTQLRATTLLGMLNHAEVSSPPASGPDSDLTRREYDVLKHAANGLTDAEIGERLCISHRTVGQHLRSVYSKLNVHSRAAATRVAIENKLV